MLKHIPSVFILMILFSSCRDKKKSISTITNIIQIQEQVAEMPTDSSYAQLKQTQRLLGELVDAPDSLQAENNYLLGLHFRREKNKDSAATYFQHATNHVKGSAKSVRQGQYFQAAWDAYANLGLYGDCFTISERFKSLLNPKTQFRSLSWALYWEESTYKMRGDYEKALEIAEERVSLARKNDTLALPAALAGKADLKYFYLKDKKGAFDILENLFLEEHTLTPRSRSLIHTNYGVYSYFDGNFQKALNHYLKALKNSKRSEDAQSNFGINETATCYINIAEVYMDLEKHSLARIYLDSVKHSGVENLSRVKQKALLDYELRLAVETNKSSSSVSKLLNDIYNHQDEIYKQKTENELLALTDANEAQKVLLQEKQTSEIENLKLQNRSIILLVSIITLSLIASLLFRQRKLRFEKQELRMQQRLLRSQMNPHFTFNTLAAIQNKLKTDKEKASSYLLKFSRLLRVILENSMQNYTQLFKEIESLKKYMDLQLFRFPNKFNYTIDLVDLEEDDLIFIPPMLIQPFVENSIEHGFAGIEYQGSIKILLVKEGKFIKCIIEDNGQGISEKQINSKESASIQLISDYIERATKSKITVYNKDKTKDETGVVVSFLIPSKLTEND